MTSTQPTPANRVLCPDIRVWRYMSFAKLVWTLQNEELWLSRADLLGDKWEVTLHGSMIGRIRALPGVNIRTVLGPSPIRQVVLNYGVGPLRIRLQHRTRLDVDVQLSSLAPDAIGVPVRDRDGELVPKLTYGREHRGRMCELREDKQPNGQKRRAPIYGRLQHRQHTVRVVDHGTTVNRVRQICLTGSGRIADRRHYLVLRGCVRPPALGAGAGCVPVAARGRPLRGCCTRSGSGRARASGDSAQTVDTDSRSSRGTAAVRAGQDWTSGRSSSFVMRNS